MYTTYLDLGWLALKRRGPEQDKRFAAGHTLLDGNHAVAAAVPALHQPCLHYGVEVLRDGEVVAVVPHPKRRDLATHHPLADA